jgi:pimeloyl-ACP methyl ester carboxylesterase
MTTTVYMLGGGFSDITVNNYLLTALQGQITNGNTQVIVPYNTAGLFVNTVEQGAALLNTYLTAGTGTMVVYGHSLGAVVASYWIANYGGHGGAPSPSVLSFVLIGNSVSLYGGALGPSSNALYQNWFTTAVNIPSGNNYLVSDIKRQYDGWADWPTGTMNTDAEFNAFAGQNLIHPNYQNVNPTPSAPGNVSYTANNITYVWSMTEPLPMFGNQWNTVTEALDAATRPTVESAYNRPVRVPSPWDVAITVPQLLAQAAFLPPTVTANHVAITAAVMAATAAMPVPRVGITVTAPAMQATAQMPVPTVSNDLGVRPAPMAATATMPAPTVSISLTITAPLMAATAAMPVPTVV